MRTTLTLLIALFAQISNFAQPVPAEEENIPFLVTFGKDAASKWGDDDYSQVFFFVIPKDFKSPIYLRIFDAECGGLNDEANTGFNTTTKFSVYGGQGCITENDARNVDPVGNYRSGTMLGSKAFATDPKHDNAWYTFGPFNPVDGELAPKYGGYVFKLICQGVKGDDGNLYRYFMSTSPDQNIPVEGGNAFTFEYTFRLHTDHRQISHVYPYIDEQVFSLMQYNFDWDDEGYIKLVSNATVGEFLKTSTENTWASSRYIIKDAERGKSLDIQFRKDDSRNVNNNNVVFYVRNQYGELLPFYTIPIGGIPRPQGEISIRPVAKAKK